MAIGQATKNQAIRRFIWVPLVGIFLILGTYLALLVPFFQGPDEQVHYATIQHWAEPDEKTWPITESRELNKSDDIRTYHFSEEIQETAHRMQFDEIKWQPTNTQSFSNKKDGSRESEILGNNWKKYVSTYPANTSGTWSIYYWIGSRVENFFSDPSILDRIFFSRLLSVATGTLTVFIAFISARQLRWSPTVAALFAALIAFQPMFLATSAVVNIDILLIFAFSLFFYGAVLWIMSGPTVRSVGIVLTAILIGIFTKGPGIVLAGLLILLTFFSVYRHYTAQCRDFLPRYLLIGFVILTLFFIFIPSHILANFLYLGADSVFTSPLESIGHYLEKTLTPGALMWTTMTYWGSFGWLDASLPSSILRIILVIEVISAFGLIWFFFDTTAPRFLPDKQILLFSIVSIVLLQFAIRFFDWRIFDTTGKILSGTPGRYFLPNIIPHLLLIVSGLGYFARSQKSFQKLVLVLSLLLFFLTIYALWFVVLPRYYL